MFKKIYWLKNFETNENLTFPENKISNDELKRYNDKGFNIYQTVNTFIGNKRQDKDLAEIKSCFIDIDYPEILNLTAEERSVFLKDKFEKEITPKLQKVFLNFEIYPSEINITYKGFHLLFNYNQDLYFIETEIHKEINNKLNEFFGGDENARDLSRVYKVPGFYDWKYGKQGKIKTIKTFKTLINLNTVYKLLNLKKIEFRNINMVENKVETKQKREENIFKNIKKINNIDALEFIEGVNTYFEKELYELDNLTNLKNKETLKNPIIKKINKLKYKSQNHRFVFLEEDGLIETSGLKIEQNKDGTWEIQDYSKKNRRGNYNFLKNWILEENEYSILLKILNSFFNISLNVKSDKKSQMSNKLLWDDHYNRVVLKSNLQQQELKQLEKIQKENKEVYSDYLQEYSRIDGFKKTYRGLFTYIYENKETLFKDYYSGITNKITFNLNDFLKEAFDLKTVDSIKDQKKIIKKLLLLMSSLTIPVQEMMEGSILKTTYKNLLELSFLNNLKGGKGNKEKVEIEFKMPLEYTLGKPAFTNKKILTYKKGFKDTKALDWILDVDDILNNTNHQYSENLESVYNKLGYKTKDFQRKKQLLKNILINSIKEEFFKSFEFREMTLYISKYENLKYNKKSLG